MTIPTDGGLQPGSDNALQGDITSFPRKKSETGKWLAVIFSYTTGAIEADGLLYLSPGLIDAVGRDDQPYKQQQRAMERVVVAGTVADEGHGAVPKV